MLALVAGGCTTMLECGPGAVLSGLSKRVEGLTAFAVEQGGLDAVLGEGSV
jgi:malonyl CoA-acyl carrier protein transacylase